MEKITLKDFEENFDFILDDVHDAKVHYMIESPEGKQFILMPAEDYFFLQETYQEWVNKPS